MSKHLTRCIICGNLILPPKRKFCCEECSKIHLKKYQKDYMKKYYHDENGREKILMNVQKYQKNNPEKVKNSREKNKQKKLNMKFKSLYSDLEIEKFIELSKRQQFTEDYITKDIKCFICGGTERLAVHHISYIPLEVVRLCKYCHAYLHNKFLKKKKTKI